MSWTPPCPTWAGFIQFLKNVVQVPPYALPSLNNNVLDSGGNQVIDSLGNDVTSLPEMSPAAFSYWLARETVNTLLALSPLLYIQATYNLAYHNMICNMADSSGQTWWAQQRKDYNINSVTVGVVSSTSDEGTSSSFLNPEVMKNLTFADLQCMKTPWGRTYLGIAQSTGSLWGIS